MLTEPDRRYLDLLKKCLTASIYDESAWSLERSETQVRRGGEGASSLSLRLKDQVLGEAARRDWLLIKSRPFDAAKRAEGRDWPLFGYTMVGHKRLDNVQACIEEVVARGIPGDLVETGVWRGGTVIFMRAVLRALGDANRLVWAADSFEGLPKPASSSDGQDLSAVDFLKVSMEDVKQNFRRFDLLDENVKFLKGWFCDSLPSAPIDKIAVLRLDGDLYSSTMDALTNLYHRVSPGGYVIVDDYFSWESCKQAVHAFLEKKGEQPEILPIDWTGAFWKVPG